MATRRRRAGWLVITIALLLMPHAVHGQSPRLVSNAQCRGPCGIRVELVLSIGGPDEAELVTAPRNVIQDRKGRYIVLNMLNGFQAAGPPAVFDARGNFLRTVGRRGRGPGEMTWPTWIDVGWDDSIRVIEQARMVVFGPDFEHAYTRREAQTAPSLHDLVVLPRSGGYVALGSGPHPGRPPSIQILETPDARMRVLREPRGPRGTSRVLGRARADAETSFWVGQFTQQSESDKRYDLFRMDLDSRVLDFVRRDVDWWVAARSKGFRDFVANTRLKAIREVAAGVVAVLIAQPLANWREIPTDSLDSGFNDRYETVLEFIDTAHARLIGTVHIPGYPVSLPSDDRVAVYRESDDGVPYLDILSVALPVGVTR